MVQKKRKSKRQTPKTRHKIHRKLKQEIMKQKKIEAKHEKSKVKVPIDILRTDEEIQLLKQIQAKEKTRKIMLTTADHIINPVYEQLIEKSDVIVQLLDARDVDSALDICSKPCINIVTKIDLVSEFVKNELCNDKKFLVWQNCSEDLIERIRGVVQKDVIYVGVVGQRNVGKSTFIHSFRDNSILCEVDGINTVLIANDIYMFDRIGHIDTNEVSLSNVFRNAIDYSLVDVEYFVGEALKRIDKTELAIFYGLEHFESTKEFLKMLGKRMNLERSKASEVGKRFLFDLSEGKIGFYKNDMDGKADFVLHIRE